MVFRLTSEKLHLCEEYDPELPRKGVNNERKILYVSTSGIVIFESSICGNWGYGRFMFDNPQDRRGTI